MRGKCFVAKKFGNQRLNSYLCSPIMSALITDRRLAGASWPGARFSVVKIINN